MSKKRRCCGPAEVRPSAAPTFDELIVAPTAVTPSSTEAGMVYDDDGTNTCDPIAEAALRYYTGSAWQDMPSATCGSASGSSSLTLTPSTSGSYTMATGTGYKWYQIGPLLFISAYVEWSGSSSPVGNLTIPLFLPVQADGAPPAFYFATISSYTGVALGGSDQLPMARVAAGSQTLTFLRVNPNTGASMNTLTAAQVASAGIFYITAIVMAGSRAAST